jgi:hypothetical protein
MCTPLRPVNALPQMEAPFRSTHPLGGENLQKIGGAIAAEVEIVRVQAASHLVLNERYINPAKWSPLIYNFRHYFPLVTQELGKTFRARSSSQHFAKILVLPTEVIVDSGSRRKGSAFSACPPPLRPVSVPPPCTNPA